MVSSKIAWKQNIKTTIRYSSTPVFTTKRKMYCKAAKTLEEATSLIEAGFQNIIDINECKLLRKLKTSYLGS